MKQVTAPCKGCKSRKLGCHSICESYAEYRRIVDENNRERDEKRQLEQLLHDGSWNRVQAARALRKRNY